LPIAENAVIGTSSARRKAQMLHHLPKVELKDLRGNVPTRVQKLRDGGYDAILLAKAGLERLELNLSDLTIVDLPVDKFVPAPAQGALGWQIRENDQELEAIMAQLIHVSTKRNIEAERNVLRHIQGGCQVPLGAHVVELGGNFVLHVAYAQAWDSECKYWHLQGKNLDALVATVCQEIDQLQHT